MRSLRTVTDYCLLWIRKAPSNISRFYPLDLKIIFIITSQHVFQSLNQLMMPLFSDIVLSELICSDGKQTTIRGAVFSPKLPRFSIILTKFRGKT